MNARRQGVAVIGLGVGAEHARAFGALPACELRWVCDLDRGRAERLVAELGQGAVADDLTTVLADRRVDIVSVATYDDVHAAQVVAALHAGKHVFVEKPLTCTADELRDVAAAWRQAERHLASNLVLRAAPLYGWLRHAIAAGELGTVYAFDGDYLYGRLEKITAGWRARVADYSVMRGGGIHLVDLMLWLTGEQPSSVSAAGSRICTDDTPFAHEDFVAATFRFPSGLIGRITANFGCVHRHQHVVRVFGTRATFIYDDQGPRVHDTRSPDATSVRLDLDPLPRSKGVLLPEFVRAIVEGRDTTERTSHDLHVMAACIAADIARKTGTSVDIEVP